MRILLQFPEGLKKEALKYAKELEKEGNEVFISSNPSFGACDLSIDEAKLIKADKLIHFGHAEFKKVNDFNVEYVPYFIDADLSILEKSLDYLKDFNTIGLITTIQHIKQLDSIKEFYEKHGKKVMIGKPYGLAKYNGQILGCDVGSATSIDKEVDAIIYFGGGIFHPLGALLQTKKPFISIDPFSKDIKRLDEYRDIYRKKQLAKLANASLANNFGILVSTKTFQYNMNLAKILKNLIEKHGKNAIIIIGNTFDFSSLDNFLEIDAFVNTACPRIGIDDIERSRKPILNPNELIEILKMKN